MQAARVEDKVRESWNLALFGDWTKQKTKAAFAELECLALLVPNNQKTLSQLHKDSSEKGDLEFPERAFLKSLNKYRGSIRVLQNKEEEDNSEISTKYLKRRYKDRSTGQETANIEELVLKDEAVFLRGVSGSGKSTATSQILREWAEGSLLKSVVCCLKISADFNEDTSLKEMFCDQFPGSESFEQFEKLAFDGKLAIIFERVDNLGTVTKDDVKEATKASGQPQLPISKRAACWGILTNRLLPGAKLLATVGSFFVQNEMLVASPNTLLYDIEDLNNEDINNLVGMMEANQNQHKMIEDRLYEIANLGNHHLLKTPMLAKSLINLTKERKIDDKISAFEVYLTLLTRNLSFCAETQPSRTRRALSDDHILHFLRFLKLFQMQVALPDFFMKKKIKLFSGPEPQSRQGTARNSCVCGKCC